MCDDSAFKKPKRSSSIWNYFTYNSAEDVHYCKLKIGKAECKSKISGKTNTSSAKYHIKAKHPSSFTEFERTEADLFHQKAEKCKVIKTTETSSLSSGKSNTLDSFVLPSYSLESRKCSKIYTKLSLLIAASGIPWSIVESEFFWDFVHEIDSRLPKIGTKKCSTFAKDFLVDLKNLISSDLQATKKVSIAVDIWTKRDGTSYLGVVSHYFSRIEMKRKRVVLALKPFSHPHSAERVYAVVREILDNWQISNKLLKIVTDNGSNMIKAFKSDLTEM